MMSAWTASCAASMLTLRDVTARVITSFFTCTDTQDDFLRRH